MQNDVFDLLLLRCFEFSKGNLNKIPKKELLGSSDKNQVVSSKNEEEVKKSVLKEPINAKQKEETKKIE